MSGLDRLEATRERIVQARELLIAHVIVRIREAEIDFAVGAPGGRLTRDATVLDAYADRLSVRVHDPPR